MNIPQREGETLSHAFDTLLSEYNDPDVRDYIGAGTPMFTPDDINKTTNLLSKLLRQIFIQHNITLEYFTAKFKHYAYYELKMHPVTLNTQRYNYIKSLKDDNITYKRFVETLCGILGMTIEDIGIVISNGNKKESYKASEFQQLFDDVLKKSQ